MLPPAGRSHYCAGCIRETADSATSTAAQLEGGRERCRATRTDLQIFVEFLGCIRIALGGRAHLTAMATTRADDGMFQQHCDEGGV